MTLIDFVYLICLLLVTIPVILATSQRTYHLEELVRDRFADDRVMTLKVHPGWFGRLLGFGPWTEQFIGGGYYWRTYPGYGNLIPSFCLMLRAFERDEDEARRRDYGRRIFRHPPE